jgi:hypothetical protein
MLQRDFKTWKILVYLAVAPIILIKIFPMGQHWAELLFSVSLMFFLLVFVHGAQIMCKIMFSHVLSNDKLYKAMQQLEDLEAGFDE